MNRVKWMMVLMVVVFMRAGSAAWGQTAGVICTPENLQAKIDVASAGDVLLLSAGLYTEPVIVDKAITLRGQSRVDCVFQVATSIDQPAIFVKDVREGKVRLENLTIKWGRAWMVNIPAESQVERVAGGLVVRFDDPNSLWDILQSSMQTAPATDSEYYSYRGAVGIKESQVEIEGCYLKALGEGEQAPWGIIVRGSSELVISGSRVEGFYDNVWYDVGTRGKIKTCLITDSTRYGIFVYTNTEMDVVGNVICGSKEGFGIRTYARKLIIKDNLVINNSQAEIYIASGTELSLTNNILCGSGAGISYSISRQGGGVTAKIENNLIMNHSRFGVIQMELSELSLKNN
ncbi:right-handed parallel beta-helix repeat-containing protein, partial [Planctomycetota bacterium]